VPTRAVRVQHRHDASSQLTTATMGWTLQVEESGEWSDWTLSIQDVVHVVRINKMLTIVTKLIALQTELGRISQYLRPQHWYIC
jgi:hypothetical protein